MPIVIDEYSRECRPFMFSASRAAMTHCLHRPVCSPNMGRQRISVLKRRRVYRSCGAGWENGHDESFNGKLRAALLDGDIFYNMKEATYSINRRRQHYNTGSSAQFAGLRTARPRKQSCQLHLNCPMLRSVQMDGLSRPALTQ